MFSLTNLSPRILTEICTCQVAGAGVETVKSGPEVVAKERRGQYNNITEKYVSTAVRDQQLQNKDNHVKHLEGEDEGQPNLQQVQQEAAPGDVGEERAANLVSHTELMKEMYSSSHQPDITREETGQAGRIDKHQVRTANKVREESRDSVKVVKEEARHVDEGKVRKKYIITQQEIVFYIKNADGKISIVHRPLITGEKIYGSLRKRNASQPNLTDLDKVDCSGGGLGHIKDVGNINMRPSGMANPLLQEQWTSSGSIFDCNQGCFSDQTVII